jgi:hypothetical protein
MYPTISVQDFMVPSMPAFGGALRRDPINDSVAIDDVIVTTNGRSVCPP